VRVFRFASDEHLVDRVRAGSAPAFEAIFDRHHRPLLAFCRHMLGSAADAEDAVQHTFMAAYADLVRSDKPITLRPWLYSIARHRCLSVLRGRRERPVDALPEPEGDHLEVEVDTREEVRATLADIARLPEDQRAALVLAEIGDVSHAEIAQVLGCRHDKVKALVFQARSTLATGRTARDTPCAEIREQLALGGVAIRRTSLRHHVRNCPGCREFDDQVRVQRRRLRVLLPIGPSVGFKRAVLGAVSGSGGGALTAGGGVLAVSGVVGAVGAGVVAATAIVSVAIAGHGERTADGTAAFERARPAALVLAPVPAAPVTRRRAAPPQPATKKRAAEPVAAAPEHAPEGQAGPDSAPSRVPGANGPAASANEQPDRPAESTPKSHGKPPDQPGQPPEPPGGGKPSGKPEGSKPDSAPRGGRPDGPPHGGRPGSPPGGGRPDGPPGGGKPDGPPAGGRPDGPPAGKPDAPSGNPDGPHGNPDGPSDGGNPADSPANPADPPSNGGGGPPADPSGGGPGSGKEGGSPKRPNGPGGGPPPR
jgi:RNA polymerase sigma factor (sigma-70 family)